VRAAAEGVQPEAAASRIAIEPVVDVDVLDSAAGCEFVDDRIRLVE
jgi:hypothetical protein